MPPAPCDPEGAFSASNVKQFSFRRAAERSVAARTSAPEAVPRYEARPEGEATVYRLGGFLAPGGELGARGECRPRHAKGKTPNTECERVARPATRWGLISLPAPH